jgi:hypothetical protein
MIAHDPLHGSGRADFPHPAPASGNDVRASQWKSMIHAHRRQPMVDQAPHPSPRPMRRPWVCRCTTPVNRTLGRTHTVHKQKARRKPRFLFCRSCNLPPVPFLHLPMIATVSPSVSNPALVFLGRTVPAAWGPYVVVAFVAVITVDPHISTVWRRTPALVNGRRRPYANCNLRKRSRREHRESKQECQCNFLHGESNPPWF